MSDLYKSCCFARLRALYPASVSGGQEARLGQLFQTLSTCLDDSRKFVKSLGIYTDLLSLLQTDQDFCKCCGEAIQRGKTHFCRTILMRHTILVAEAISDTCVKRPGPFRQRQHAVSNFDKRVELCVICLKTFTYKETANSQLSAELIEHLKSHSEQEKFQFGLLAGSRSQEPEGLLTSEEEFENAAEVIRSKLQGDTSMAQALAQETGSQCGRDFQCWHSMIAIKQQSEPQVEVPKTLQVKLLHDETQAIGVKRHPLTRSFLKEKALVKESIHEPQTGKPSGQEEQQKLDLKDLFGGVQQNQQTSKIEDRPPVVNSTSRMSPSHLKDQVIWQDDTLSKPSMVVEKQEQSILEHDVDENQDLPSTAISNYQNQVQRAQRRISPTERYPASQPSFRSKLKSRRTHKVHHRGSQRLDHALASQPTPIKASIIKKPKAESQCAKLLNSQEDFAQVDTNKIRVEQRHSQPRDVFADQKSGPPVMMQDQQWSSKEPEQQQLLAKKPKKQVEFCLSSEQVTLSTDGATPATASSAALPNSFTETEVKNMPVPVQVQALLAPSAPIVGLKHESKMNLAEMRCEDQGMNNLLSIYEQVRRLPEEMKNALILNDLMKGKLFYHHF